VIRRGLYPNRDELLAAVRIVFGSVQMAVLALSEGGLDKLREFTREASRDYRNVLYWSEFTKPGTERRVALEQRLADAGQSPWGRA